MQKNDKDYLVQFIQNGIEYEVKEKFEEIKKAFIEKLDKDKDQVCAGIALNVMGMVDISRSGQNVMITIKKIEDKK